VPFFMALVAADALSGTLTASLVATALLWLTPKVGTSADILNAFYLAWALPFAVYLAGRAYGTSWEDVRGAFRSRAARGRAAAP
jgi:steroid 5-alpha reductase family enzyme